MRRFAGISLALFLLQTSAANAAEFYDLGDLFGGVHSSAAYGVSADGMTVVGVGRTDAGYEAFQWTADGGMAGLGYLPGGGLLSRGLAVSGDGSTVVGESISGSGYEAFLWTSGGGMVGLGDLPDGDFRSIAQDVSADGTIVAGTGHLGVDDQSLQEAFVWTSGGGMVGLGALSEGMPSEAYGISADGSTVVGMSNTEAGTEAFTWTAAGGMVGLGELPGGEYGSTAWDVSANGSTVVGASYAETEEQAFRWAPGGGMVGLGALPGGSGYSAAYGVSADGSVVVGTSNSASGDSAFIWDASNGMRSLRDVLSEDPGLDLTGWRLETASGISADGRVVVGYDRDAQYNSKAWMVVLDAFQTITLTSVASGPWNAATTWDDGTLVPTMLHEAVVGNHVVTVAEDASAYALSANGASGMIMIAQDRTLAVAHNADIAGTVVMAPTGRLTVGGDFVMSGGMGVELGSADNVPLTVTGNAVLDAGASLYMQAVGSVGDLTVRDWGDKTRTLVSAAGPAGIAGTFATEPLPNEHLGCGVFYQGLTYHPDAVDVDLFQAAPGDTDGSRFINGIDIQNILAANKFGQNLEADWTEGDFDNNKRVNGLDIQAILAANLFGMQVPYAAMDSGKPGDGIVDLVVVPGEGLYINTDGVVINSYVLTSAAGIFTGEAASNLGVFQEDTDGCVSGSFAFALDGEHFLGNVVGPEWQIAPGGDVDLSDDLLMTYTIQDTKGTYTARLVIVPEPGTLAMLAAGVVGLWVFWRRRRPRSR
ncbi:MAG: PEP-CTERM sorting domain-containing protein [Pirellulales bacterium]|nr:PEP-CTERM sorting domain-containing protein [Pirellulales bacterium]